jgi:hypothetical protein
MPHQDKSLSDDTDAMLAVQGVGWAMRKAIQWATITLHIKQYVDDAGTTHIDIDQTATGGMKGTSELRALDWVPREHEDYLFGKLVGQGRWIATGSGEWEALDQVLKDGWLEDENEKGGPNGETHVQSFVDNKERGWTAEQIWGFAVVEGQRYHTRRVVCRKGDQVLFVRLVYTRK